MNDRPRRNFAARQLASKLVGEHLGRRHKPDYWVLVFTALLMTIGLVVVYSISPALAASQHISQSYFVTKQLIAVGIGALGFIIAASLPVSAWRKHAKTLAMIALVGCAVAMITPVNPSYPAHRWIRLGSFSFQVAELIKVALLVWTASFLSIQWKKGRLADFNSTLKPLLFLMGAIGIVVAKLQSDLGSTGVMIVMMGMMAYTVGIPLKRIAMIGGLVIVLLILAISSSAYRRERVATFLHPEKNCQSTGYQECQALISVGSGGLFGLGLGYSVQAYGYLPEPSNDSIFAIIAEKFGFIGTVSILAIYAAFITRLTTIVSKTSDQFSRLLVVGVLAWLSTQMLINVGAMVGLLPLKGITLPLISQGGTSLVFLTAALGLIFQISRYTSYSVTEPTSNEYEAATNNSLDGRRVGRSYNPTLTTRPRT